MSENDVAAQLTLKDRLNYPYLLANQILTFQKAILNQDNSKREINEAIEGFVNLLPTTWKDEQWNKDVKDAEIIEEVDMRNEWCGRKVGNPKIEKVKSFDYLKMFHACIDLLDRRRLITKVQYVEELESLVKE